MINHKVSQRVRDAMIDFFNDLGFSRFPYGMIDHIDHCGFYDELDSFEKKVFGHTIWRGSKLMKLLAIINDRKYYFVRYIPTDKEVNA